MLKIKNSENMPKKAGIYKIKNKLNHKVYIGQSVNIYKRINGHHNCDYLNSKNSCFNSKFYKALRKYGVDNFEVKVLEECEEEFLNSREIYWIQKYDSFRKGYNSTVGGLSIPNSLKESQNNCEEILKELNSIQKGEKHPKAKLLNSEVVFYRQLYKNGLSVEKIWERYLKDVYDNVSSVKQVIFGRYYKEAGNIPSKSEIRRTNKNKNTGKIPMEIVAKIREDRTKGLTLKVLSEKYGIPWQTIGKIVTYKTYKQTK